MLLWLAVIVAAGAFTLSCSTPRPAPAQPLITQSSEVPDWSRDDMQFFLHGSMGTEFVPESILRAFMRTYPALYPTQDLSHLGLIQDPSFGWPVGFSLAKPLHLAELSSVGINCASCHVTELEPDSGQRPTRIRILGVTSHFDVEAFFGSVITSTFLTQDPPNMKRFFAEYFDETNPEADLTRWTHRRQVLEREWDKQKAAIEAAIADDPAGEKGAGPGGLQPLNLELIRLTAGEIEFNPNLAATTPEMLKLFHNMRAALHVPDTVPEKTPPASGPGRNDAFGLLSYSLLMSPQPYAPSKFGVLWNLKTRRWVHWDGDSRSPIERNLLAALGLGAPLVDGEARLDFKLVQRHTQLSESIIPPRYPFFIDKRAASRGAVLYQTQCSRCHDGSEDDNRLFRPQDVGTDPTRAKAFTPEQAQRFTKFLNAVHVEGFTPAAEPAVRSTQMYWAPSLPGVWARSPYLHNGSVRTMRELLTPPRERASTFRRGSRRYVELDMGYTDDGVYVFDTAAPGNSNSGHDYGTSLTPNQKRDLIEYLKSL